MPTLSHSTKTATDLPERKPLYLLSQTPSRLDAGADHLVLYRHKHGGPLRFPLVRVCRIICNRYLAWSGAALSLCLTHHLPITWVDGYGHALGNSQTRYTPPPPFSTLIESYLELPDWPDRFANWLARRRLDTLTTWARRTVAAGHALAAASFDALKRDYVYKGEHPLRFDLGGKGWCHALAVDHLQREGLQTGYWGFDATRLELAAELSALLWAELNLDCGTMALGAERGIVIVELFERWSHRHEYRLTHHLGDLKRHLAREVEAWR